MIPTVKPRISQKDRPTAHRRLQRRIVGMVSDLVLFHVFLGWAIACTSVDLQNHFHTNYWALAGAAASGVFAVYHMSTS